MKQLEDKKLLERYKAGERDFCNFALHNTQTYTALGGLLVGYCSANLKNANLENANLSSET